MCTIYINKKKYYFKLYQKDIEYLLEKIFIKEREKTPLDNFYCLFDLSFGVKGERRLAKSIQIIEKVSEDPDYQKLMNEIIFDSKLFKRFIKGILRNQNVEIYLA